MKSRSLYVAAFVGIASVVGGTVAAAQTKSGNVADGAGLNAGSPDSANGAGVANQADSGSSADESPRSPQLVLQEGRVTLDRMEATSDNISRMLRVARDEKDVVKTLCLDDKLNQIDVAVRSAADRLAIIEAAVQSGASERLDHDDTVLGALGSRAGELAVEANQCIGEESGVVGQSQLTVVVDPNLPEGDVSAPPTPVLISAPPVASSPTL